MLGSWGRVSWGDSLWAFLLDLYMGDMGFKWGKDGKELTHVEWCLHARQCAQKVIAALQR